MTTLELNAQKTALAGKILDETNETIISLLAAYFDKMKKTATSFEKIQGMPYTDEEKRADIELAMDDIRNGRTITHEEFVKKHAAWW